MPQTDKWRITCTTEGGDFHWHLLPGSSAPTTCPNDTGHTIDATATVLEIPAAPDPALDHHGNTKVTQQIAIGGGFRYITHDYTKPVTWWHESTEHTGVATSTSDSLTYTIDGHTNLIDVRHGKLTFEDGIDATTVAPNGNTMTSIIPQVYEDAVLIPDTNEKISPTSGDEYSIDYENGTITFAVARTGTITVDFRKSGSSKYIIVPGTDERLILEDAEIDVSEDIDMSSPIQTQVFGSHTTQTGGAIVLLQTKRYKTFHDFQAAARKFWGPVPASFGGSGGVASPKWTFQWEYSRSDELYKDANYVDENLNASEITLNRLEVSIDGDQPLGGSVLTMTFYGQETAQEEGG